MDEHEEEKLASLCCVSEVTGAEVVAYKLHQRYTAFLSIDPLSHSFITMSAPVEKAAQYGYTPNSGSALVLNLERGKRDLSAREEVASIAQKMSVAEMQKLMGSRATGTTLTKDKEKKRPLPSAGVDDGSRKKSRGPTGVTAGMNVLTADVESVYRPLSRETRAVYETLLSVIQEELGDKPHDVLASAADEVISVLKDDSVNVKDQQVSIEQLFGHKLDVDRFRQLVNIGQKITDYKSSAAAAAEAAASMSQDGAAAAAEDELDEQHGVAVVFGEDEEGDEEEGGGRTRMDQEEDDDEDEDEDETMDADGADAESATAFHLGLSGAAAAKKKASSVEDEDDEAENELDARTIDAHWMQRQVSTFISDPHQAQKTANEIFTQLSNKDATDAACENALVTNILGFDQFNFIKLLLRNRWKIVYCIRLHQLGSDTPAAEAVKAEMAVDPRLRPILTQLAKTTHLAADKHSDLERTLMREARNLGQRAAAAHAADAMDVDDTGRDGDKSSDAWWARRPKVMLDLDSLAFQGGGHFMSSGEVKLPQASEIINKTGYQEVHIPPLKPQPAAAGEKEVLISDIPTWARPAFKGMKQLNRVQSRVYETAMKSAENMLICAPTGAGKTNVAMLTMLREIGLHQRSDGSFNVDAFKIIYVAPMKSLVQEMVLNFGRRLEAYGIKVAELSGDQTLTASQLAETQVIVTTPEKWDVVTRKSGGDRTYTQLVKLIIIDEVHLLHDSRGATLESIVARTIRQIESTQELIRLVGLSATLPNYEDVALFLRVKPERGLFFFDNSFRPVPLQQQYVGITTKKAFQRFQLMNQICYEKVSAEAGKNQILVFVHSRKETSATARALRDQALSADELSKFVKDDARRELLTSEAENVKNQQLKELLPYGFAIHHAGLSRADRKLVEELFDAKHIQVLVCTATLAWGVNLPAHTVIIKGTQVYDSEAGGWKELSMMDVQQMQGRAGRPQYDVMGDAIVITSHRELSYYLTLLNEQLPVESQFIPKLADNLNAEIVLGTVSNMREAVSWLGYTYLYVRMLRAPQLYGITHEQAEADPYLEQRRIDLIHTAATLLDKHHLIKYDKRTGVLQPTDLGRVASSYYLTHQSLTTFNDYLKPTLSDIELFRIFALSSEFKQVRVREEEKIELAKLMDKVPIPVKEGLDEPAAKINVLLQAYISRLALEGYSLMADMVFITQSAGRLVRALFEIVLKRGWAAAALKCLTLAKMVDHRMWAAQSPLRQFEGRIPNDIIKRIEGKDISWEQLYDLEAPAIGELIRFPKMGKEVYKCVHQLPRLELQGSVQPITRSTLRVELTLTPDFQFDPNVHGTAEPFYILVEDVDSELLLHHEFFLLKRKFVNQEHVVTFTVPLFDPMPPCYYIRVVSDRWLGSEVVMPMSFRHLLLPEKFAPPTELLDLQPISTTEIAHERWIDFFSTRLTHFNPIQTQVFSAVYRKNENVLVAAPTGSGKSVIAELAIIRQLIENPRESKIVYIAPLQSIAEERYKEWQATFGAQYGLNVVLLPGDPGADLKLLTTATLIISTPDKWDVLSRRWKTRKPVQDVSLFIIDELQLIAGKTGPTIEIIVSRMRFMASQLRNKAGLRILGLSASVANAKDLGEWLGAPSNCIFNFHPPSRPLPLEIRVTGFDHVDFNARTTAMIKPAYTAINNLSPSKPVFVFVPSAKFARSIALEFITYAVAEDRPDRFLHDITRAEMKEKLQRVRNATLVETLSAGIGFLYEHMAADERTLVETLYRAGHISILVIDYALCWGISMFSHLTIVLGCQQYDSAQHRYVDLPLNDIQCMIGRSCRPHLDTKSLAVLFCPSAKKEFLKKFLYQPAPVESQLDHDLADPMLAEIITKRIETVQDAVDYLTWSFLYRRLTLNPNFYNLAGTTHRHFSDHLSELVENTLEDLQQAKMITVEDETEVAPLNSGLIAAYYYLRYTTIEIFARSLQQKTKLRGLLEILSSATEFDDLPVRPKEEDALRQLSRHLPVSITNQDSFDDPHTKCNVLLQAHFSRIPLAASVARDLAGLLPVCTRLLQAMVDVLSSLGWLSPALACMELAQMVTQGMWSNDSVLMQLPGFSKELVARCKTAGVTTIPDLMDMEDVDRDKLLQMNGAQMAEVARVCNAYPDIEVTHSLPDADDIHAGSSATLNVRLLRDPDDEDAEDDGSGVPLVHSQRYPGAKTEGWWLVLGNPTSNELVAIKRVAMSTRQVNVKLEFTPSRQGHANYMLYLMSDSYLGCDQEYEVELDVKEPLEEESEEESDDEE